MRFSVDELTHLRECIARDQRNGYIGVYSANGVMALLDTIDDLRAQVTTLSAKKECT